MSGKLVLYYLAVMALEVKNTDHKGPNWLASFLTSTCKLQKKTHFKVTGIVPLSQNVTIAQTKWLAITMNERQSTCIDLGWVIRL